MDQARYVACYRQWIAGQEAGLGELVAASANAAAGRATDAELRAVVERCMLGYQDYVTGRRALSREVGTAFFAPPWCTAFENSVLWLGGCRPSMSIRLLYSLSGEGLETHLEEFISGRISMPGGTGLLGITAGQLALINDLHHRTLRQEDALSERLATLQEDIADRPLLPIVRARERERAMAMAQLGAAGAGCNDVVGRLGLAGPGGVDAEVDAALESYKVGLARLLNEADGLRMATTRALATEILTPPQAVEMLMAAKQLHLSVRDWSRRGEGGQQQLALRAATAASAVRPNP
ncbi:protein DOG1-like 3 [Phragmites australis]|uniref:protein DOG1-like 3 n=1 Tax=Phragmites australis TaxID=29695 RepID=UPI002D76791D|nr:protein DOG1-like 3 [Phragmites australis]